MPSSIFFISLEDELPQRFGEDRMKNWFSLAFKGNEDMPLQSRILTKFFETAQKKVEGFNFDRRKGLLDFDNVISKQREIIYGQRKDILFLDNMEPQIENMMDSVIERYIDKYALSGKKKTVVDTEPFMEEFATIGLDSVVGSVGNGSTLRLISDIEGVKYTEGRFLPYFFPDTFYEGGDPVKEAKENWVTARRAILRKPIDRIGYGGYLKLALDFPEFIDYVESVCDEFRELYENAKGTTF